MTRIGSRMLVAAGLLAAAQVVAAADPPKAVKVYVDGLPANVAEQVKRHAQQGETALRKYLNDSQKMHRLSYEDVTQPRMRPVSDTGGLAREPKKHATDYK